MSEEWYYAKGGQQLGPVSQEFLHQLAAAGQLRPMDLVWSPGMPDWAPARDAGVPLAATPAPRPPRLAEDEGQAYSVAPVEPGSRHWQPPLVYDEEELESDFQERRRSRSGTNALLLGIGAVICLLVVAAVVVLAIVTRPGNPRTFHLRSGEARTYHIEFPGGSEAWVRVVSEHDSDVDLFIYDSSGMKRFADEDDSKDCYLSWVPHKTETYKVEVVNRIRLEGWLKHRNRDNTCTLSYSEAK